MGGDLWKSYGPIPFFCGRMDALSRSALDSTVVTWGICFFVAMEVLAEKHFFLKMEKRLQKLCIFPILGIRCCLRDHDSELFPFVSGITDYGEIQDRSRI